MADPVTTPTLKGPIYWESNVDNDGYREYTLVNRVWAPKTCGPARVMLCPGLPVVGSPWNFFSDYDPYAACQFKMKVTPQLSKEQPYIYWDVENNFSTKPISPTGDHCSPTGIGDPLLFPPIMTGSFIKYAKEALKDKDGEFIRTSSLEAIHGHANEWDHARGTVKVKQNVGSLNIGDLYDLMNQVNSVPMWGFPFRTVKLSGVAWERFNQGNCQRYYTRELDFDIDMGEDGLGFDRDIIDEGSRVLNGHWNKTTGFWTNAPINSLGEMPDRFDPTHFIQAKDKADNACRLLLDGLGNPKNGTDDPHTFFVEYYKETNFFLLGVPSVI